MNYRELPKECDEIIQTLKGVKGELHSKMVTALFSIENVATFLINQANISPEQGVIVKDVIETQLGQFLYCFTMASLKQDPKWHLMSTPEQDDKAQRFLDSIQTDVLTLDKKQKEYWK